MGISEIEKLERRYADNPQGLTFAPLAEVYRKLGEVPRALELLRPGLELHPDYIPASIVLGRCHLDLGEFAEAERAFARVLELDGENVIALKALADISERLLRYDEAERRLNQLLSVDRSHEEAREQLARIEIMRRQVKLASPPGAEAVAGAASGGAAAEEGAAGEAGPVAAAGAVASEAERGTPAEPVAQAAEDEALTDVAPATEEVPAPEPLLEPEAEIEPLVLDDVSASAEAAASEEAVRPAEGVELQEAEPQEQEEVTPDELVQPLAGLMTPESDTLRDELIDFRVEKTDEMVLRPSGASEFQMPDASLELGAPAAEPELAPEPVPALVPEPEAKRPFEEDAPLPSLDAAAEAAGRTEAAPVEELAPVEERVAAELSEPERAPAAAPEPPLIVTETMAEVLLQQGHTADALRVYQELARRSPDDERLRARVADLELRIAAPPTRPPSYAARDTGGRPVAEFFRELLASRLPAAAPRSAPPSPALADAPVAPGAHGAAATREAGVRPASDALSLSAVFGEDSLPVPPAIPAVPPGSGGSSPGPGVSFDEFFGRPAGARGVAGSREAAGTRESGAGAPPTQPRSPGSNDDDLDQFHNWLQNLKR